MIGHGGRYLAAGAALLAGGFLTTVVAVTAVLGSSTTPGAASGVGGPGGDEIPAPMLTLYRQAAATCPGLDPAVLAAVGRIETDHGRSRLPGVRSGENSAGAGGPMQFLAPTFAAVAAAHPPPPGGAHPPSRYNPHDAVFAAAAYLCDSGARTRAGHPGDITRALLTYNHSSDYVAAVLAQARRYRTTTPTPPAAPGGEAARGQTALAFARRQLGQPYLWAGDGPAAGDAGFDCSGLTWAAWAAAGISIPRTAHAQYQALAPIPITQVRAGDLLFFGSSAHVHHVGIATGEHTQMIHAPTRGSTVRVADARSLPDLLGAARPGHPTP